MSRIFEFINTILTLLVNAIQGVVWLITNIPSFMVTVLELAASLPGPIMVFVSISLSITVLVFLLKVLL